jgi:hypothetical protein
MKKFLNIILISFFVFFINNISAKEEKYWDNEKISLNLDSAKTFLYDLEKKYNSSPDPIEGIWENGDAQFLIYREADNSDFLRMYIIKGYEDSHIYHERSWEATFIRIKDKINTYGFYSRVWYGPKPFTYDTQGGYAYLNLAQNFLKSEYLKNSDQNVDMDDGYTKIWSTNNTKIQDFKKDKNKVKANGDSKNYYDFWWVVVLVAGLLFYLYSSTVIKPKKTKKLKTIKAPKLKSPIKEALLVFWRGDISYGFSYWIYGSVVGTLISIPALIISDKQIDNFSAPEVILYASYVIFLIIAKIYLLVGIWRSAEKYKAMKTKLKESTVWGYLGQISLILSILRGIGNMLK